MSLNQNRKKNNSNKWLALINIPIQMGIIIYGFSILGDFLDVKYPNPHNIFKKAITMLGVVIAFYNIIKQVNRLNDNE